MVNSNERVWTVYEHIFPNNKRYIGITSKDVKVRWLNGGGYKNQFVGKAIIKFGWDNVKHKILFTNLNQLEAENKERFLIKYYKTQNENYGYNIESGGIIKNKKEIKYSKDTIKIIRTITYENNPFENKGQININVEKDKNDKTIREVNYKVPSFTMVTDVAFQIQRELKGSCFAVYLTILKHRNTVNNECYPTINTICRETGLSDKPVKMAINKLEEHGYLSINSGMRGIANNYYFPKEAFYSLFEDDFFQQRATRRHGRKSAITEKRESKNNTDFLSSNLDVDDIF